MSDEAFLDLLYSHLEPYYSKLTTASLSYAQQCYGNTTAEQECSVFVQREIPQIVSSANCPFPGKSRICLRNATNLRLDTGLIDSHNHLGINAAPEDRFYYRNLLECGPLRTEGYTRNSSIQTLPFSDGSANVSSVDLLYGGLSGGPHMNDSVTWEWPIHSPETLREYEIELVQRLNGNNIC